MDRWARWITSPTNLLSLDRPCNLSDQGLLRPWNRSRSFIFFHVRLKLQIQLENETWTEKEIVAGNHRSATSHHEWQGPSGGCLQWRSSTIPWDRASKTASSRHGLEAHPKAAYHWLGVFWWWLVDCGGNRNDLRICCRFQGLTTMIMRRVQSNWGEWSELLGRKKVIGCATSARLKKKQDFVQRRLWI